jgi:hypothetical protein
MFLIWWKIREMKLVSIMPSPKERKKGSVFFYSSFTLALWRCPSFLPPLFLLPPRAKARAPFPPLTCRIALRTLRTSSPPPPPISFATSLQSVLPCPILRRLPGKPSSPHLQSARWAQTIRIDGSDTFFKRTEKLKRTQVRTFRLTPRLFGSPSSLRSNLQGGGGGELGMNSLGIKEMVNFSLSHTRRACSGLSDLSIQLGLPLFFERSSSRSSLCTC